jgi:hypothetical protein
MIDIEVLTKRLAVLTEIARWVWLTNMIVTLAAIASHHFVVAVISGFTFVATLIAAAMGRKSVEYLSGKRQAIPSVYSVRETD